MQAKRIIPVNTTKIRRFWLKKLGGITNVSVRNKEWLALLKEDTRNSLMIEGYFVTRSELKEAIENPKYSDIEYKILGYFDSAVASYELAFQQYRSNEFKITIPIIRQIHSMLFRGDPKFSYTPGEWRKGELEITGAKIKTASPFLIEKYMKYLVEVINSPNEDLIRKIAITHTLFEQIHPFPDGNGRVGRILMNFILVGHGLPNIAIKGSEPNKVIYINSLEEADPIVSELLKKQSKRDVFAKPVVKLEDLINKALAISMDVIICHRYNEIKPLVSVEDAAKLINKSHLSIRVACSQKKYISCNIDGALRTHPDLFATPEN